MFVSVTALRRAGLAACFVFVAPVAAAQADLHPRVKSIIAKIEARFGRPVTITSGCRGLRANRRSGGARGSLHLSCRAADIKIAGVAEGTLLRYAKSLPGVGGVGTYCRNGIVHIDIGPKRQWHEPCRRNIFKRGKGTRVARR